MKAFKVGDVRLYVMSVPRRYWRYKKVLIQRTRSGDRHCITVRPWIAIADVCRG